MAEGMGRLIECAVTLKEALSWRAEGIAHACLL